LIRKEEDMSQLSKIGVVGAGNMGSGIVQKIARKGLMS